jgi:AhpD family alkylhydroperoxidase
MERADFKRIAPAADAALLALSRAAADAGLEKDLLELVKLRASQINGCAFCLQLHLTIARDLGIPSAKLDLLVAWREAGLFSSREQAALDWTETLTGVSGGGVPDETYAAARAQFSEAELAFLTAAIGAINAWNRVAVAYRFTPPVPERAALGSAA